MTTCFPADEGLARARFRRGACAAALVAGLFLASCGATVRTAQQVITGVRPPSSMQEAQAKAAWAYFKTARSGETDLVEASAGAGFTSPSALGDHLIAAVAARRLGIIEKREFDANISTVLGFLGRMELSGGFLPGRTYSGRTGRLVVPPSRAADPGWSAVELGRLLQGLRLLATEYPQYRPFIANDLARWSVCTVTREGDLQRSTDGGTARDLGTGWYDYAAFGWRGWGMSVRARPQPATSASIDLYGETFDITPELELAEPVITTPLALLAMESGWRAADEQLAGPRALLRKIMLVQARRHDATGLATMRSSFHRSANPYEVIDTVLLGGYPWSTAGTDGRAYPDLALTSTAATFAADAVEGSAYTSGLLQGVATLNNPDRGWFEGRYELTGGHETARTSLTNSVVLEALFYRNGGRIDPAPLAGLRVSPRRARSLAGRCLLPALVADEAEGDE